jgi:Tol biopolymer transport system component
MIAWSPDGESLAIYADDELYNGVLYTLNIKSGEITALFKVEEPNHISHLSW